MTQSMCQKRVLLIVGGGIAACKVPDLVRGLRELEMGITPVMTQAAEQFITPLTVSALSGEVVHRNLFDPLAEAKMGHIELSRSADLVVVAPATADLIGKMACGLADDLASTLLLATDKPVLLAPAMNLRMWTHAAVQRNVDQLRENGVAFVGPDDGRMACGESGPGRMAEPESIICAARRLLSAGPLSGRRILITSGATREAIDPVRFLSNRSSGKQGSAIAEAALALGAEVIFVTGPSDVPPPHGVHAMAVETAAEMLAAVNSALPVDAAIFAAAVADWRPDPIFDQKMKRTDARKSHTISLVENPDILAMFAKSSSNRPKLVIGFAAETDQIEEHARQKLLKKGCDWILANDVGKESGVFGGSHNEVTLITRNNAEHWPRLPKSEVAKRLIERVQTFLDA